MRFKRWWVTGTALMGHLALDVASGGAHLIVDGLTLLVVGLATFGVGRWLARRLRTGAAHVH